jgi:hypothetical protein
MLPSLLGAPYVQVMLLQLLVFFVSSLDFYLHCHVFSCLFTSLLPFSAHANYLWEDVRFLGPERECDLMPVDFM